jgi:hypothetical protein
MISIIDEGGPLDYNILDNLKLLFIQNGLMKEINNNNVENNISEEDSIPSDKEEKLDDNINEINSKDSMPKKDEVLKGEDLYLINGDDLLEEYINKRKHPKKKKLYYNFLKNLEIEN